MALVYEFLSQSEQDAGIFISFLADILSSRLNEKTVAGLKNDPQFQTSSREFRHFYKRFLLKFWPNLSRQYDQILTSGYIKDQLPSEDEERDEPELLITEFQQEINEVKKGNLDGWRLLYSTDFTTDDSSVIVFEGETLEEKAQFLQNLAAHLGQAVSVKTSSIITAIDNKTQAQTEDEKRIQRKRVRGEIWLVLKRGNNMRILYRMDQEKKEFRFFLYQKNGWEYDLPAV